MMDALEAYDDNITHIWLIKGPSTVLAGFHGAALSTFHAEG